MQDLETIAERGKEYEKLMAGGGDGIRWLPYLMFFANGDYTSPVVNTDPGGFRVSHGPAGPCSLMGDLPDGEVSVLLGGSPAFGFGASADEETIPSHLATGPDAVPWLNLACNGFNSTQEVILFLLHRHQLPAVRDIVVLSGLNTLVLAGLPGADRDYGQFFFSGEFARRLGLPEPAEPRPLRARFTSATHRLLGRGDDTEPAEPEILPPGERIDLAVRTVARDLDRLTELAAPTGARVHFALQPVSTWTGKPYTDEERQLIEERGRLWDGLFSLVLDPETHEAYARGLRAACEERALPFLDLNPELGTGPAADQWLFLDLVHLTDQGNRTTAELLRTRLGLADPAPTPGP
ncbi:hypothetical protein SAMN06297387_107188 [Streptomyces zhaozhouensis]|uniref:GDSL-like Lipase/Acylhydrolase family protein n=1 Tax=Streptomyces zhaozhouensis TaxID=1300267 RepID=A0A286DW76_9ACTN|nr:IopA [Streptomyces zhaozhouensis]SOD62814.1 hypothetical protein SAMN06297387_107188 [Streptomyces zhaozhouensis]